MKKFLPTLLALFILAGLVTYALLFERGGEPEQKPTEIMLQDLYCDELSSIHVQREYDAYTLEHKDGEWRLTEPVDARSAELSMDALLDTVCSFKAKRKLTDNLQAPGDYGFDRPLVTVNTVDGEEKEHVLIIGGRTPVDEDYYVMRGGDKAMYVAASYDVNPMIKSHDDMRDKSVAKRFEDKDVMLISVTANGKTTECARKKAAPVVEEIAEPGDDEEAGRNTEASVEESATQEDESGEESAEPAEEETVADEASIPEWNYSGRPESDCVNAATDILDSLRFLEVRGFLESDSPVIGESGLLSQQYLIRTMMSDGEERFFEIGDEGSAGGEVYFWNAQRKELYLVEHEFTDKLESFRNSASKL